MVRKILVSDEVVEEAGERGTVAVASSERLALPRVVFEEREDGSPAVM